jgi:phosphoglycolate phosphatase-like HAD superfamily hydrolase
MPTLALDFDGVLCDSVAETAATAWRAGAGLWSDMTGPMPPAALLAGYRRARPVVETGYEAILVMRLLLDGLDSDELIAGYRGLADQAMRRSGRDVDGLKALFSATRDRWLTEDPDEWVSLSPFYPGVVDWLRGLAPDAHCCIVTTKEGRFVERLLAGNGIAPPPGGVYGLEQGRPKEAVLLELIAARGGETVCFVEDRLATLERCLARPDLSPLAPRLAGWGYNTEADRQRAGRLGIPVWGPDDLFAFYSPERDK